MHRVVGKRHADEGIEPNGTDYRGTVAKTETDMRDGGEWEKVHHRIAFCHTKDIAYPFEQFKGGQEIMGRVEKRRGDTCCRSSRIVHTPQDALVGKELRQRC